MAITIRQNRTYRVVTLASVYVLRVLAVRKPPLRPRRYHEFLPVASLTCRRIRVITARENGARVYPLPKMSGMRGCISCTVYRGFQNAMNTRARGVVDRHSDHE